MKQHEMSIKRYLLRREADPKEHVYRKLKYRDGTQARQALIDIVPRIGLRIYTYKRDFEVTSVFLCIRVFQFFCQTMLSLMT